MNRWLILTFALGLAVLAAWVMLTDATDPRGAPLDDIDDASRARLERALREGERR